uniref:Putative bicoid mrna stability factor n=1 Tax=Corethrella appendiculata TaxID=1370023 RepID=W4VRN5_9DIPT
MASILRSNKFVRYFAGFARNIIFNSSREYEGNLVQQNQCFCNSLSSSYATSAAVSNQNLERSLKRLDQDVRRSGRISRRDIEDILEEIRVQRSATSSQSLLVIRCCGNLVPEELPEVRTTLVQEIWKTLNNLNIPMDISHYNALLRVYLENEYQFSPTEFLADLEAKGIEPNRVTFQRLISRYCQTGDIEGATRILEFMREKQLPVNENVFNALIMGHSQADDMESASGILSVMKQAGLEPSADTYTTLLCGYARKGDIEEINKNLNICDKNEIYLLDKDMLEIIYSLATNGYPDSVDTLIERVRKSAGYNQDAVNVILRLINKGQDEVALKLLRTMPRATKTDGQLADTGNFLIRQMVKAKRPVENILKTCKLLTDENLNAKATLIAVEAALTTGDLNIALTLLKELQKTSFAIRQHYFWPLMCAEVPNKTENVLNVIEIMQKDFDIMPSGETIREFAIPNLQETNLNNVITLLKSVGVSLGNASVSCTYTALLNNDIKTAAEICSSVNAYYAPTLLRKTLVQALLKTQDYDSYIKIVRQIYDNIPRGENFASARREQQIQGEEVEETQDTSANQAEILGDIIYDVLIAFRNEKVQALEQILKGLVNQGLSISNQQAERIEDKLGSELTTEISTLLGILAAGDLEPIPIEKSFRQRDSVSTMSIPQLEKLIENVEAKGDNAKGLKRQLITAALKSNDVQKTEEIMAKLESENYVISAGVYAQLIDFYCNNNKLEEALNMLNKIRSKEPDFKLDMIKLIKVAQLFVNADKYDEALKFLTDNKAENFRIEERTFNYNTTCWRLLNAIADKGKADELNKVFDNLVENKYIHPTNILLGPLVKVYLVNNDLEAAVKVFEQICLKYRSTPWKNELACRLIQAEDAQKLQRLTDLSTDVHGEVNSLYDLVFSFIDCGRIRQARKILETPGLRSRHQRINLACERYHQEGQTKSLEGLMEATKDLNHIDRADIYYNLLLNYIDEKLPEKALGLWTKMQEEDIAPNDTFLLKLADFLKANNCEIPFVVPAIAEVKPPKQETSKPKAEVTQQRSQARSQPVSTASLEVQELRKALKTGDVDKIIASKQKITANDKLSVNDRSRMIEEFTKSERFNEATKLVAEMLGQKIFPIPRVFRFYLNRIAANGEVETLNKLSSLIPADLKKVISFDNRYCHANIVAGKTEQYLQQLEQTIDNAKSETEITEAADKFPRGGSAGILEAQPELVDRFEVIAEKYIKHNIIGPMNVLWMYHFISGNESAADSIWNKHLQNSPRIMFQRVIHVGRERNDDQLISKLVSQLKTAKVSEGAIGNVYSCLIDIYCQKEKFDDGLQALNAAVKDVCLDNINRTALIRLKDGLEKAGQKFPFTIPEKISKSQESSSSSSSSSSDDDVHAKKN